MEAVKDYDAALKEFETITSKKASTIKNKGKEAGLKKISVLFKKGKDLGERCADYDATLLAFQTAKNRQQNAVLEIGKVPADKRKYDLAVTKPTLEKAMTAYSAASKKLVEGLKANRADTAKQFNAAAGKDDDGKKLTEGLDIFLSRLEKIQKHVNMEADNEVKNARGVLDHGIEPKGMAGPDAALKTVYLTLRKAIPETDAAMKTVVVAVQKAAAETDATKKAAADKAAWDVVMANFSSGTNARSLAMAVTGWDENIAGKHPDIERKVTAKPAQLKATLIDLVGRKGDSFWKGKLKPDQPGWYKRAIDEARMCLTELPKWAAWAKEVKPLIK